MIISESEKSRIKSLYGLIKEDVPHSESVLVANKNPFKYNEFKRAQKPYNSKLKDGDLFYEIINKQYIIDKFKREVKSTVTEYNNKTLRIGDEIYKIEISPNPNTLNTMNLEYYPYFSPQFDIKYGNYNETLDFEDRDKNGKRIKPNEDHRLVLRSQYQVKDILGIDDETRFVNREVIDTSQEPLDKFVLSFRDSLMSKLSSLKIDNLPDDLFEIRKVQRQKTDF